VLGLLNDGALSKPGFAPLRVNEPLDGTSRGGACPPRGSVKDPELRSTGWLLSCGEPAPFGEPAAPDSGDAAPADRENPGDIPR
jgi:hypothetical protein